MRNLLYYFSGTGNSLWFSKQLAAALGETERVSIADLDRSCEVIPSEAQTVGIVFPVYCFGVPDIVLRFLKRLSLPKGTYCYAVCTCGGMKGSALHIVQDALDKQNAKLHGAWSVTMPSNYIPLSDPPSERRIRRLMDLASAKARSIANDIQERKEKLPVRIFPFDMFGELVANRAVSFLPAYDRYFWLTEACDGCGLCETVCPASNIIVMNGMPTWRGHCEQCMACLHWCPKEAIQFKQISVKRKRYHHPDIQVSELVRKSPAPPHETCPDVVSNEKLP